MGEYPQRRWLVMRHARKRRSRAAESLLLAALLCACGPRADVIRMDPIELHARRTPEGIRVDVMDPEHLFLQGVRSFESRDLNEADHAFTLVIERFADSRFARPSRFNRGLVRLQTGRPSEAAADFQAYIETAPDSTGPSSDEDLADAWQKLGQARTESGDWEAAVAALRTRLGMAPLTMWQEVEVRARLALALRMLGLTEECRAEVSRVLAIHDRNLTLPEMDGNYFVAMASFQGAEVWHDLFTRIRFVLPVERMEKDLVDKATLFLKAQSEYLRTIRLRNTYWGVKAGVAIGRLYEEFFEHILQAEVPPELTPDEVEIYFDELKRRARPLLAKAVDAYERNLALARMYGARDEWFGDTQSRLARLRKVLDEIPADPPSP